ncbi:MAG: hypothetical protein UR17_C0001G0251 [Candidatus Woesebacteria bacterium GW2011_GWF1_31_35]|uniref:Uncharacterized protein n=1 Tax=Candidatus Woesebacteria bacterium GW2011_GWC2_31_9 TaxID=1618586 RepID=A0A0F9YIJ5_9BACT|nr:MAG: hypothetical protein UR17_C0001G0251 [Candidatus Woesebacteria bacterium GW2011_GWF1_31_35]KKP23252.1 MAG: hypothetical protein UR11_C0001G0226 [Candidatus Woesebacteria bacterium GW2011_GWC1_30_29]KKP25496.1 MAG: hypothetical protein UR13_C0008G0012 [Candidatus Woesebacteria bacterium GW2011_GWD1_31_12]KKP27514.1 MAG: hypothetical protein UR16_C0003G0174 [Candidatus Woesebacteria bacterium GW2011_GWB1_31_29]KKP30901.1 MAG: hypothetical protein UR20_C0048G0005 [Candidatus Woesebacteria 
MFKELQKIAHILSAENLREIAVGHVPLGNTEELERTQPTKLDLKVIVPQEKAKESN